MIHLKLGLGTLIALTASIALAQTSSNTVIGQAVADAIREAAGSSGALVPNALIAGGNRNDLSSVLRDPTEEIVVVNLTGSQLRQAFERSLTTYPTESNSFLFLSGFDVTVNRNAPAGSRVVSMTAGGSRIADGQTYSVAMPSSLGRGGLGYFKIWDKSKIAKTLPGVQLGSLLKGKRAADSSSRYSSG